MWGSRISDILNIRYPIIQGPFGGGYSSQQLAAAVSNAGGMGSFGAHHLTREEIIAVDRDIRSRTDGTYAINLWVRNDGLDKKFDRADYEKLCILFKPYFDELSIPLPPFPEMNDAVYEKQVEAVLEARPPVFSFVYGIPDNAIIGECKRLGIKTIGTATTVDEALALEGAGVDVVTATGFEAGGHRVSFLRSAEDSLTGLFSLIPQVADRLTIPFLAAGGIADGRGIAAALALGADGVQVGTAFLACEESNAPALHRAKIFSKESNHTVLTRSFTGRLARGTESKIALETRESAGALAPYPLQGYFVRSLRKAAIDQKRSDLISFWAGQSAALVKYKKADELFVALVRETESVWSRDTATEKSMT
ncbi:MAG: NAD(P)H-dependent flavin oxidoreductase [Bacteroidota bacterium]